MQNKDKKIGFIGLGNMGFGMAVNLVKKSGLKIHGFDVIEDKRKAFAENGGTIAKSNMEIYKTCNMICIDLPTNDIVKNIVTEITENAQPGTIIVDFSSTSPYLVGQLYKKAQEKNMHLIDSPVSGGPIGADTGTLAIMTGGEKEIFDEILPYLEMMGKSVTYMGASGTGSMAKVANNMIAGSYLIAIGEGFAFAKKNGIEPETLFKAIRCGFAQCALMDNKLPKLLKRDFTPAARIAVHLKDINNAMEVAKQENIDLPMTKIVKEQMDWMGEHGMIDEDQCALIKYYEAMMGVEV